MYQYPRIINAKTKIRNHILNSLIRIKFGVWRNRFSHHNIQKAKIICFSTGTNLYQNLYQNRLSCSFCFYRVSKQANYKWSIFRGDLKKQCCVFLPKLPLLKNLSKVVSNLYGDNRNIGFVVCLALLKWNHFYYKMVQSFRVTLENKIFVN